MNLLIEKVKTAPDSPGVYIMKDGSGKVNYVGKAKSLYKRLSSYFLEASLPVKTSALIRKVKDVDYIVTGSEIDALILENKLIKEYKPRFNIRLKDDKTYPYLKITQEDFPRLTVVRRIKPDSARYFGPYTSSANLKATIKTIKRVFRIRTCKRGIKERRKGRPCLDFHIQRCLAPCIEGVTVDEYQGMVRQVCDFLDGKSEKVLKELEEKMRRCADCLEFEKAGRIRDQICAIKTVIARQQIVGTSPRRDIDVVGISKAMGKAFAVVLSVREGRVVQRQDFYLEGDIGLDSPLVLEEFIKRFYSKSPFLPKEVLIPHPTPEVELIERWLRGLSGRRVKIRAPRRGKGVELIDLAQKSARSSLEERERAAISEVEGLKEALSLPRSPVRIEAFDLSSIKGVGACGGMVTFVEGRPDKSSYRRFRIKEAFVMSDVDMLREVIKRRYKRILEKKEPLPDLILVDGGQQQTLGCFSVLHSLGLEAIPIIGLAKKEEKVYTPTRRIPITLPEGPPLNLLKRIRDEAHRFAHAYHLRLRKRKDKD